MKRKKYLRLTVTSLLLLGSASIASASVPPPPVNQNIGILDGVFNNLNEGICRGCHEDATITKPGYLPDRHHLKVGTNIPQFTDVPYSTGTASGPSTTYECLSCHKLVYNATTKAYEFELFRDCLLCHVQTADAATVHHRTQAAKVLDCKHCHGPIDNPQDGHYIPSYIASLVTPKPGIGTGPEGRGGCAFCHNAGIDAATGFQVFTNAQTHHSTGVVLGPYNGGMNFSCALCHDLSGAVPVRTCEACHGVNSLHNIQFDANSNGIEPGMELAYYGHIGHQDDCWGCHGFIAAADAIITSNNPATAVVPDIAGTSKVSITRGENGCMEIFGAAFTNMMGSTTVESIAEMVNANTGKTIAMSAAQISEDKMTVCPPGKVMEEGPYRLRLKKLQQTSNSTNVNVVDGPAISEVKCAVNGAWANVKVMASNLTQYMPGMNATNAGVSVTDQNGQALAINSWDAVNGIITASAPAADGCPTEVTVKDMFMSTASAVGVNNAVSCTSCHEDKGTPTCDNKQFANHVRKDIISQAEYDAIVNGPCDATPGNSKNRTKKQ